MPDIKMTNSVRLLRAKQVAEKLSISQSTFYRILEKNAEFSDFPQPRKLSAKWVVWIESEVDSWILSHLQIKDSALPNNLKHAAL